MALNITVERPKGISVSEKGRSRKGETITSDKRLFMQMLAFGNCTNTSEVVAALKAHELPCALYEDLNDPYGIALVAYSPDPAFFLDTVRGILRESPFATLTPKPEYTLFGRTYASGYESDLNEVLLQRPVRYLCNPDWPWVVWYPLRRKGSFEQLSAEEQRNILMEHGGIGRAYGKADHAHDIRLACHGLDRDDNDFIVALMGKDLGPLSKIVQHMRRTKQTSQFLDRLGPFFIGRAVWQHALYPEP